MVQEVMAIWVAKLRTAQTREQKNAIINTLRTLLHIQLQMRTGTRTHILLPVKLER
jgi:hypothetical protein